MISSADYLAFMKMKLNLKIWCISLRWKIIMFSMTSCMKHAWQSARANRSSATPRGGATKHKVNHSNSKYLRTLTSPSPRRIWLHRQSPSQWKGSHLVEQLKAPCLNPHLATSSLKRKWSHKLSLLPNRRRRIVNRTNSAMLSLRKRWSGRRSLPASSMKHQRSNKKSRKCWRLSKLARWLSSTIRSV